MPSWHRAWAGIRPLAQPPHAGDTVPGTGRAAPHAPVSPPGGSAGLGSAGGVSVGRVADEPEATRFTIHHEGEIAGMVQFGEDLEPKYRHASIDIFVAPAHQGRGVCTESIRLVVDHLLGERGHHRITIDPAADNAAAIACYAKVGFRPVGVMRLAERDADGRGWHDSLMMELVVEPE